MQRDEQIFDLILEEQERQIHGLELIASENFVSDEVMEAAGSVLTNKYAEGTPGHRFYGGCVHVDTIEQVAIDRAKALFGAEHANVQPHSGAQANTAVYMGILEPGDTVLGMRLDQGGHLTHGSPANLSGKYYNFISYGVDQVTETIDYEHHFAYRPRAHHSHPARRQPPHTCHRQRHLAAPQSAERIRMGARHHDGGRRHLAAANAYQPPKHALSRPARAGCAGRCARIAQPRNRGANVSTHQPLSHARHPARHRTIQSPAADCARMAAPYGLYPSLIAYRVMPIQKIT